jgi:hypothetical protein
LAELLDRQHVRFDAQRRLPAAETVADGLTEHTGDEGLILKCLKHAPQHQLVDRLIFIDRGEEIAEL